MTLAECKHNHGPTGYIQWHYWAAEQIKRGRIQVQCKLCRLWVFR